MIVDENAEFRSYTANKLREEGFDVVLTTSDPKNALDAIEATSPDVVLFDLIMVGLDGIAFLEQAGKMPFAHRPRFIATSTAVNEMMIKEVMRLGASYFLVKPINYSILTERIHQICSVPERKEIFSVSQPEPTPEPRQVYIEDDLEKQVTESILEIGIPAHVKGYHYVRSAIMLAVTDPEAINAVTKIIYPTVAKQYKTSPSRVERAIRHAIEVAWDRGDDALRMVEALAGRSHFVYTGVCVMFEKDGKPVVEKNVVGTEVFFRNACEEELKAYVATGEPMGKAGAYAIQGRGGNFVERINGDWSNVVGLPVCTVIEMLEKAGIRIW